MKPLRIPAPPAWLFWAIVITAVIMLMLSLSGCSYPLRFDPHRDDLRWKQQQCQDQGGSPEQCRPK